MCTPPPLESASAGPVKGLSAARDEPRTALAPLAGTGYSDRRSDRGTCSTRSLSRSSSAVRGENRMRERGTSGPKRQRAQAALRLFVIAACLMQAGLALGAEADVVRAASRGDLEGVRAALAAGGQVGATQNDGSSALLWAAYHADLEMTQLLLEAGADPNVANRYGVTPLLQASRTGDAPIVAALLAAGADVARTHPEGETALMGAARAGSVETVELLLEHGADPNARESFQEQTALMWAADEGHADVV